MARRAREPKNLQRTEEPELDSLAKNSRIDKPNPKQGKEYIQGNISTLVREQILKDGLDRTKRMDDTRVVLGKGGKDLELFSEDISIDYDKTIKNRLVDEAKQEAIKKGNIPKKVLLKKVSENDVY